MEEHLNKVRQAENATNTHPGGLIVQVENTVRY
jgi:hypothetical protein